MVSAGLQRKKDRLFARNGARSTAGEHPPRVWPVHVAALATSRNPTKPKCISEVLFDFPKLESKAQPQRFFFLLKYIKIISTMVCDRALAPLRRIYIGGCNAVRRMEQRRSSRGAEQRVSC